MPLLATATLALNPLDPHSLLASLGALGRRADRALRRYGPGKAIVLARFIPLVRTVANPLAGTVKVPARRFTLWQVLGGLVWVVGVTLAGYALGSRIPSIDRYLLPIIAVIVQVSLLPILAEVWRTRRHRSPDHRSRPYAPASNTVPSEGGRP